MVTTTNLGLTLLEAAQAQKEITINEGLVCLDALLGGSAIDKDLSTPPASPATGAVYIVGPSPTGAWAGQAKSVTYFNQTWRFITPVTGMRLWVSDESTYYSFNGTAWAVSAAVTGIASGGTGQTSYTDGQLLIGNSTGNTLAKATLTAGTGIAITNGSGAITITATGSGSGVALQACNGRLTLTSNTPVTTADVTAATTLYFTPFRGNHIALYDGTSAWITLAFTQLSIAVPATANTMYDVFVYNNAGAPTLEVLAWTNDTTRATMLTTQDGVYVKSGATTRRYLGSFRTTGTSGKTEDSLANRFVWNYYNRVLRQMKRTEATVSWTYSTAAFRQANGSSANQLNFIIGISEDVVSASLAASVSNNTGTPRILYASLGINSTTVQTSPSARGFTYAANANTSLTATVSLMAAPGYTYVAWLEFGGNGDTQTWLGNNECGLLGSLWG